MKTIDLHIRPIHHHLETRVRAHIFLCMLAYYVEWHMREAWRELMFADKDLQARKHRDPVAAAQRSEACLEKVATEPGAALLLHDDRARGDSIAMSDIANAQLHEIAAAQLAVDRQIEQRELALSIAQLKANPNCPMSLSLSGAF